MPNLSPTPEAVGMGIFAGRQKKVFHTEYGAIPERLRFAGPITKANSGEVLGPFILYAAATKQPNSGPPNLPGMCQFHFP